jgi:two-component system response regulator AtoC
MPEVENIEILVVDDELLTRDLLYDFLSSENYTVHLAEDGKKAISMIDEVDFKVALVDLKMPEIDGLEVASVLSEKKPYVPVVIMTAYPSVDSAVESIKKGIFDYIIKPFNISQLSKIISKAVNEYMIRANRHYTRAKADYDDTINSDADMP